MTDMNEAKRVFRQALEECSVDFGRVSIANDLVYWACEHADTHKEAEALIRSSCDFALELLNAIATQ
jgi:hypothetical protein